MSSLLAHLFTRIKGSPENVAVLSLHYILSTSLEARSAFARYLSEITQVHLPHDLWFKTESTGANRERPDLVVYDREQQELLVCEAKFWAGLTANQPQGYLDRIANDGNQDNSALVFICPHQRITSLWHELARSTGMEPTRRADFEDYRQGTVQNIPLAVVSWRSLLRVIGEALAAAHSPLAADLRQLEGLCDMMDAKAFIPFNSDDLSVAQARRISSYYQLVDEVARQLRGAHGATQDGLRRTYYYAGYAQYLGWRQYGIGLLFHCEYWQTLAETPYWLLVYQQAYRSWVYAQTAHRALRHLEATSPPRMFVLDDSNKRGLLFPLYAPCHAAESEVVHALLSDALEVLEALPDPKLG